MVAHKELIIAHHNHSNRFRERYLTIDFHNYNRMKCPRCEYEWESKVPQPKECPRCKGRLDYWPGPVGAPKVWKKKEVRKEMTSKLPWAAAAAIIVVAGLTTLALWPAPAVVPGVATIAMSPGVVLGAAPGHSGIRAIHIMRHVAPTPVYSPTDNLNLLTVVPGGALLGRITATGGTANIPHGVRFDIVIDVVGHDDNMAHVVRENLRVWAVTTGAIAIPGAYTTDAEEHVYATLPAPGARIFVNARRPAWTNLELAAGATMTVDNIRLWLWT
jgi:hypothetical protein